MTLPLEALSAISPLDGRYAGKCADLRLYFSEYALIRYRIKVELAWLRALSECDDIPEVPTFSSEDIEFIQLIDNDFDLAEAQKVKDIEATTNHDVKAVEYYIKQRLSERTSLSAISEFVHFACTSEDINNLAYGMMLNEANLHAVVPMWQRFSEQLKGFALPLIDQPMLSRTHGQTASPTTVGKEMANVVARLERAIAHLQEQAMFGKINGAVGNFNAHYCAYPTVDWPALAAKFVSGLGLQYQSMTTQIEPHDYVAEYCHGLNRLNTILLDFNRDVWGYISLGYFKQRVVAGEVGSSTMPHKVNPIDFENSEGNLGLGNALLGHLADKLPVSRWQRDLTDSTVLRNLGVAVGYSVLAVQSSAKGLGKLAIRPSILNADLEASWEVLAEPIQTVMRRYGIDEPYEKLKALTRGEQGINQQTLHDFIAKLDLPEEAKSLLCELTPQNYVGIAQDLASVAMQSGDE